MPQTGESISVRPGRQTASRRAVLKATAAAPMALAAPLGTGLRPSAAASPPSADGLEPERPSRLGLDATALNAIVERARGGAINLHSLLVMRHGKLAAELYRSGLDRSLYSPWASPRDFSPTDRHDMRSISKSVVGLLYGVLLARGEAPGLETPVAALYPECRDLADAPHAAIRIRNLLTMTAGLDWTEPSPVRRAATTDEIGLAWQGCAYRYVFQRASVAPPGAAFSYSGGLTAVLAEIMERSTQRSLRAIAEDYLFAPLGVTDWEWIGDIYGKPMAAAGLRLRPRDLLKIGALVLGGGQWQGRRIAPSAWIAQATTTSVLAAPVGGYGFQWWTMTTDWRGRRLPVIAAIGNGGQRLFLAPALDLAVATTAGDYGDPAIAAPLNALFDAIVATASA